MSGRTPAVDRSLETHARLAALASALTVACTSTQPTPEPEPEPVPALPPPVQELKPLPQAPLLEKLPTITGEIHIGDRVLLRDGGRLRAAPDTSSASAALRIAARPDADPDAPVASGALVVVGVQGDFVEIDSDEMGALLKEECAPPIDDLYVLSFRAFVHRDDLMPVIVHAIQVDLSHGTFVRLSPGIATWPRASGDWAIDARGVALTIRVPQDAIGLAYQATSIPADFPIARDLVDPAALLLIGDAAVGGRPWLYGRRPTSGQPFAPIVRERRAFEAGFLVDVGNRCADLTAYTDRPPTAASDPDDRDGNVLQTNPRLGFGSSRPLDDAVGGLARTRTAWGVDEGTPFTTLGGVKGKLRHDTAFTSTPEPVGRTLCLAPNLGGMQQPELRVCFAREAVKPLAPIVITSRIKGDVNEAMVWRLMAGRSRVPFLCDDRARKSRPDLAGKAVLRFDLPADGGKPRVSVDISGLPGGQQFARCLEDPKSSWLRLTAKNGKPARVFYDLEIGPREPLPR